MAPGDATRRVRPGTAGVGRERPNVIIMMTDDLGWGDIGTNGGKVIQTPHIDSLAEQGVLLTDGYVSAAVCSPSRVGLYTGRYQQRHGFEFNIAGRDTETGMSTAETTIADKTRELRAT